MKTTNQPWSSHDIPIDWWHPQARPDGKTPLALLMEEPLRSSKDAEALRSCLETSKRRKRWCDGGANMVVPPEIAAKLGLW